MPAASSLSFARLTGVTEAGLSSGPTGRLHVLAVDPIRVLAGGASSVDADASSLGGRGAAAAIALSDLATRATLSGRLDLDSPSVTVNAENASSRLGAIADSAGGQGASVGALAVGVARTVTASTLATGAVLSGREGATDAVFGSSSTASASAAAAAGGAAPSLAVLVADHSTESVADLGSDLVAPHDATWRARTRDVAVSDASRGSAAGNAVTLSTVRTRALLADGPALTGSGSLTLEADQQAEARSRATLVAVTFTDHRAIARSDRDVRMSGPVTVSARNRTTSTSVTNPAVDGAGVSPALVVALLRDLADHVALSQSAAGTGSAALPALGSAVVDSIALNVVHHEASAVLPDDIAVVSGGALGVLAESFLTAVATGGSAGGSGSSADHSGVAVNLVRRVVVVVVSRETESAGDLTVRAGRGPPGTELISASSPSHPSSTTLNQVTSSIATTVHGTTTIDSTTGATPVAAPQMPAFTPPAGSVLITPRGGTVRVGAATLTFAPGSLPTAAWILIRQLPAAGTGLLATSAVYDLLAYDALTGAAIHSFPVAPVLSVAIGEAAAYSSIYYLDPSTGPERIDSTSTGGTVSAALPHFSPFLAGLTGDDLIQAIATVLADSTTTPIPTTEQTIGDKLIGSLFRLTGLKLTYSAFTSETSADGTLWTGSVTITATGGTLGSGTPLATVGDVSATYTLSRQLATQGTFSLTAQDLALAVGSVATATADSVLVEYDNATGTFRLGATGVSASIGPSGVQATLSNGSFGMVVRMVASQPKVGLLVTGDLALDVAGVKITQPSWRFGANELTDLDSAPVTVQTGLGDLTLDLVDGAVSLTGNGTIGLGPSGSIGSISGSYAVTVDGTGLAITVTNGSATLKAGTQTLTLTGLGGTVRSDRHRLLLPSSRHQPAGLPGHRHHGVGQPGQRHGHLRGGQVRQ